ACPLVLPSHIAVDRAREAAKGAGKIGTTGRGIGPAYEDKVARRSIRVRDLMNPELYAKKLGELLDYHNFVLEKYLHAPRVDLNETLESTLALASRIEPLVADVPGMLHAACKAGQNLLFEGAQGTLLDVDHGTYPYVTSSNCVAGAACAGAGIGPTRIDRVLGITKAYTTRVGGGPFPTEETGALGERLRAVGAEHGATTGRPRRCGWLGAVMLREAATANGFTELAINKPAVLWGLPERRIATAYRVNGKLPHESPMTLGEIEQAEPVYEPHPGWQEDLSGCRRTEDLPEAARRYVERVEALVGVPVDLLSVGPNRDETIARHDPFRPRVA